MKRLSLMLATLLAFTSGLWIAPTPPHTPMLHGYVMPVLRGADGQIKALRGPFHNVITNTGKNDGIERLINATSTPAIFNYVGIGTNATAEAATDTTLGTECASSTRQQDTAATPDPPSSTGQQQLIVTFAAGNCTATVTEAGVFNASTSGTMLNRKTFGGITKGASDSLEVTITFTLSLLYPIAIPIDAQSDLILVG